MLRFLPELCDQLQNSLPHSLLLGVIRHTDLVQRLHQRPHRLPLTHKLPPLGVVQP